MILFLLIFGVVFVVGLVFLLTFGAARMMSKTPLAERDPSTLSPGQARLVGRMVSKDQLAEQRRREIQQWQAHQQWLADKAAYDAWYVQQYGALPPEAQAGQ